MEKEEDEEERKKRTCLLSIHSTITQTAFTSSSFCLPVSSPRPPPDLPVCAKNISLTANGEKVILWTRYMSPLFICWLFLFAPPFVSRYGSVSYSLFSREADRVILTRCQQDGANQNTFQAISTLLGNKTPTEVICSTHFVIGPWRWNSPPISPPPGFLPFSGFDGFV